MITERQFIMFETSQLSIIGLSQFTIRQPSFGGTYALGRSPDKSAQSTLGDEDLKLVSSFGAKLDRFRRQKPTTVGAPLGDGKPNRTLATEVSVVKHDDQGDTDADDDIQRFCDMTEVQSENHKIVSALRRDLKACIHGGVVGAFKSQKQAQLRKVRFEQPPASTLRYTPRPVTKVVLSQGSCGALHLRSNLAAKEHRKPTVVMPSGGRRPVASIVLDPGLDLVDGGAPSNCDSERKYSSPKIALLASSRRHPRRRLTRTVSEPSLTRILLEPPVQSPPQNPKRFNVRRVSPTVSPRARRTKTHNVSPYNDSIRLRTLREALVCTQVYSYALTASRQRVDNANGTDIDPRLTSLDLPKVATDCFPSSSPGGSSRRSRGGGLLSSLLSSLRPLDSARRMLQIEEQDATTDHRDVDESARTEHHRTELNMPPSSQLDDRYSPFHARMKAQEASDVRVPYRGAAARARMKLEPRLRERNRKWESTCK